MAFPILSATAWREFRGVPSSRGTNQTTHLALIEEPNGKQHLCYVKLTPPEFPTPLTEALGWLLAEALDLPRPAFAALVLVPMQRLRENMRLDQHWLRYPAEHLAFCAEVVDGRSPAHSWRWLARLRQRGLYKRPEIARIAAFDAWVANQDRNSGNLLVSKLGKCIPIDNEYILYPVMWNGRVAFQVGHKSLIAEARTLLSGRAYTRLTIEMAQQAKLHDAAFTKAIPDMHTLVTSTLPAPFAGAAWNSIHQFLAPRAQPGWLAQQLGVIV
jgi:hypothetical protein